MDRYSLIAVLVLVFIQQGSDASFVSGLRKLVTTSPDLNNATHIAPSPAPISKHAVLNNSSIDEPQKSAVIPNNSSVVDDKGSTVKVSPVDKDLGKQVMDEKCNSGANTCIRNKMIACLKKSMEGPQNLTVLIQNESESVLNVSIIVPAFVKVSTNQLEIPQHQSKKIEASADVGESHNIILRTVYGDCVLYSGVPISDDNFFGKIPYANQVTPMHGAYLAFLVALIIGGACACCKLGKKRQPGNGGVPYQELEMAVPESVSAVNVDGENGWDEGWDDDWDEEKAVKSPGTGIVNPSANGLTSRSANSNGWEKDWDE